MRKLVVALGIAVVSVTAAMPVASAAKPSPRTFVAVLDAANEVPTCTEATNAARGAVILHVVDESAGTVRFTLVANNLPGDIIAAHIHIAPKGTPGPIVEPLPPTPGVEHGVIAEGTFTNPGLVAALQADPAAYYVNVHSTVCMSGVIRGQLGDHGPGNH